MKIIECYKFLVIFAAALTTVPATANFFIDHQGTEETQRSPEELRRLKGAPDGYRLLEDKTYGVIHQIGEGEVVKTKSFGTDKSLKDAISLLMPSKWIAYIEENIDDPRKVDWQAGANGEPWLDVLDRVGKNYGYRFVVDWDQELLQISSDEDYIAPDYNDSISLKDPKSGRTIFVYSAKPVEETGVMVVDGQVIPVKLNN
ncbi:hypothetical protein [Microbulbifer epialgicus]|uniref:Toxin co-regulated pilus biosynthesis protein Q n=1 Tax=Microbulbifer epialgicus TaxID=393907 RepID=A0ABV4NU57_9GAMM